MGEEDEPKEMTESDVQRALAELADIVARSASDIESDEPINQEYPQVGDIGVNDRQEMMMRVNGQWERIDPRFGGDIEGTTPQYGMRSLEQLLEEMHYEFGMRLEAIEKKVERAIECLKNWDGTGYNERSRLIEGLNWDPMRQITVKYQGEYKKCGNTLEVDQEAM